MTVFWKEFLPAGARSIGYLALVERYSLIVLPHHRWSFVCDRWKVEEVGLDGVALYLYPRSYDPGESTWAHLEFALKHEGIHLHILKRVLEQMEPAEIVDALRAKPTGKYARVLWYLYELFAGAPLPLADLKKGAYVPVLDAKEYYCGVGQRSQRHRVEDNLLGGVEFSPVVRRTARLCLFEEMNLGSTAESLLEKQDRGLVHRAFRYLYTKETMASWEIEQERPSASRLSHFVDLLDQVGRWPPLSESMLIDLQKQIVDPRFALNGYRTFQNYVGEEPALGELLLHFISPKPGDLPSLMKGWFACGRRLFESGVYPVIAAAILSFGFVFFHPFWDGNGRIHRLLIHYVLAKLGFSPPGALFPISSVMVRDPASYDRALESFSRPLGEAITEYTLSQSGELNVSQETVDLYRFIDFTAIAEYLFELVRKTVEEDYPAELDFLERYDRARAALLEIVEMPSQRLDLFIKCLQQNDGKLSTRKRERYFSMLSQEEIEKMEGVVNRELN